jgi:hypothetical protein
MKRALSIVCVALAAACAPATEPDTGSLEREFGVREGEQVVVDDGRLTVGFQDVTEDSRCPTDAQCVWAGEATVVLRLWEQGREPAQVTLRTTEGKQTGTYGAYSVALRNLDPKPRTGGSAPETYLATLEVRRR